MRQFMQIDRFNGKQKGKCRHVLDPAFIPPAMEATMCCYPVYTFDSRNPPASLPICKNCLRVEAARNKKPTATTPARPGEQGEAR